MSVPKPHLMVVDDDERIRELLRKFLIRNGFLVTSARDAEHALRILSGLEFDLIVLDVMMPGLDGIGLTRMLRERTETPILLLTAKGETGDRIVGLEAGADDYLPKPFEPKELVLRINAILRRTPEPTADAAPKVLALGSIRYHLGTGDMRREGELVSLTATQKKLMELFSNRPGETLSRTELAKDLGRNGAEANARAVDVHITRLRQKIEPNPKEPRYLKSVRGEGYMLDPDRPG